MSETPSRVNEILRLLGGIERDNSAPVPRTAEEAVQEARTRILAEPAPLDNLRKQVVEYFEAELRTRTAEINADAVACINQGDMTLAADFAELSQQFTETLKAAADSAARGDYDPHLLRFWQESRQRAANLVTESDFEGAFQAVTHKPEFSFSSFPVVLPTLARIKRREEAHKRWAELRAEGLSWAKIQKRHKAETGQTITTDAIRRGVERFNKRYGH